MIYNSKCNNRIILRAFRGLRISSSTRSAGNNRGSNGGLAVHLPLAVHGAREAKNAISGGAERAPPSMTRVRVRVRVDCLNPSRRAMSSSPSSSSPSVKVFYDSQSGQSMTVTSGLVRLHER